MQNVLKQLNPVVECRALHLSTWQCPPFLVLLWGFITILSIVSTYLAASRYAEEETVIIGVTAVTIVSLMMGATIISSFNRIAETNRLKTEFVSIISHQLRSPLSIFQWTIDATKRELARTRDLSDIEQYVETLQETSESMTRLVNTLVELNNIETGILVVRRAAFRLDLITQKIIDRFQSATTKSKISISFSTPNSISEVYADENRIVVVIENVIDNAIRYSNKPGKVEILIVPEGKNLKWSIKDQGVGIPAADQKYIFQRFFRAGNALYRKTTGLGTGLYLAKMLVEASGGEMGFYSKEDQGSTFWFTLPLVR